MADINFGLITLAYEIVESFVKIKILSVFALQCL